MAAAEENEEQRSVEDVVNRKLERAWAQLADMTAAAAHPQAPASAPGEAAVRRCLAYFETSLAVRGARAGARWIER